MQTLKISDIISRLGPFSPNIFIGIGTLLMMGLAVIALLLQRKPDIPIQLLLTSVILFCLIDKIATSAPGDGLGFGNGQATVISQLGPRSIFLLLMRVPIFIFPFIAAGMMRRENVRGILPAIIGGFIGIAYVFSRWYFEMR